jgi:thymidylate synthase
MNIVFNFAEALWYAAGRDDLDFIAYYAPSMRRYSMDGRALTGTAYGSRIFGGPRPSQWATVIDQLTGDPDTKRAVIQIFDGSELRMPDNIDVACTLGLQFFLREGSLHCVAYMRANDAFRGMLSDVFSFTFLQELLATQLGAQLGTYTHVVGSLHVYASDDQHVRRVLADESSRADPPFSFPRMPMQDNWPVIRHVLDVEQALRTNRHQLDPSADQGLPRYWHQVLVLLEFYRRLQRGLPVTHDLLGALEPIYRFLVGTRWRDRLPAPEEVP